MKPEQMKKIREAAGLSQRQMAEYLGLVGDRAAEAVRQLENGKREPSGPILRHYQLLEAGHGYPEPFTFY